MNDRLVGIAKDLLYRRWVKKRHVRKASHVLCVQVNGTTNGHANGAVNGHANGTTNGHANGYSNGHSEDVKEE